MTLRWLALFLALLAHLAGWVLRPRRRLNWMTPAALEQWRRGQRRMGYPATLVGLSLATWGAHTAGAGCLALQLAAGIVLAIALRSLLSLARAWCWVHGWGWGHAVRVPPRAVEFNPIDPQTLVGPEHETVHHAPRTQTALIYQVQQHYRACHAEAISHRLGRRVDNITAALALFLMYQIGDEDCWLERLDQKMRMWFEPMLPGIRFAPDNADRDFVWDLAGTCEHPRVVLLRTDEAAAKH